MARLWLVDIGSAGGREDCASDRNANRTNPVCRSTGSTRWQGSAATGHTDAAMKMPALCCPIGFESWHPKFTSVMSISDGSTEWERRGHAMNMSTG